MAAAELAALVDALPERPFHAAAWVDDVLRARWSGYGTTVPAHPDVPVRVRAWSVGCVLGTETLVQSRPVVRDRAVDFLDDFLRTPAPCTMAMFTAARETSRPGEAAIARFQRWIGACCQPDVLEMDHGARAELRGRMRADMPDFLRRSFGDGGDEHLLFFGFLARLHRAGGLGPKFAERPVVAAALVELGRDVESAVGDGKGLNLIVHDGRSLAMLHRGGTLTRWLAPDRPTTRTRTGPLPAAGIPRGAALFVLSRDDGRDPAADPLPDGVFALATADPASIERH